MPERFPPLAPVPTRILDAGGGDAGVSTQEGASFVCLVRGLGSGARSNRQVARHIIDVCMPIFQSRQTSMLDDLAELWWKAEHEGARVRPFSSLPIAERAELRARVKQLLASRTADTLGDQAVLEGETKRLLDLPELALRRAHGDLERRAERDRQGWNVAGAAVTAIFAAGSASIAHLGDCRAGYLRSGRYEALTHEHTLPPPSSDVLTRAVGLWREGPERVTVPVEAGDVFLFTTREVAQRFSGEEIAAELRKHRAAAARSLVGAERMQLAGPEAHAVAVEIREPA